MASSPRTPPRSRIKDPKQSLDFYTRVLGFRLLEKLDFPDAKFSLYFLGYHSATDIPEDRAERVPPPPPSRNAASGTRPAAGRGALQK